MIPHVPSERRIQLLSVLVALALGHGCRGELREEPGQGHAHGGEMNAPHGHGGENESQSFTLFSGTHELFIELAPAFAAGKISAVAAHVTELREYKPVLSGKFTVALRAGDRTVASVVTDKVARPGIFTPKLSAPAEAGEYQLSFHYEDPARGQRASWDAGPIRFGGSPAKGVRSEKGEITFLKETQWVIPFRVEQPVRRKVARTLTVPATVTPDPRLTQSLSASAAGRVEWATERSVTLVGSVVRRGDPIGRLVPAAAAEHWSTLRQDSEVARIERQRSAAEHERVARLVRDGLVAGRRLQEVQAGLAKAEAALRAARQREGGLRGGAGPVLALRAPATGAVAALHVPHGQKVTAGELLAEVTSDEVVLVRATVFQLDLHALEKVHWAQVRRVGVDQPIPLADAASALLTRRIVIDPRTLSAPLVFRHRQAAKGPLRIGDLVELTLGVGELSEALTVPAGAVVELGTQPCLFLMVTGESFTRRRVRLGPSDGERVAILEGLSAGERVVTVGGLDVYVSSMAGSLRSHQHQ
jgi:RND family efflux transporter MFP subunit